MTHLQAGAGVTIITPPLGTALSGLFNHRPASTVHDDLTARALVLDDGETRVALVVCDLILVTHTLVDEARAQIADRYGIPGERVMISATHTHTGPATLSLFGTEPDPAYLATLPAWLADSVGIAVSRLRPARVAWGAADVDGICFNRRFRMRDGTVMFNPPVNSPEIIEPVAPVDPTVTALLVEDLAGNPLALWANLALHYVGTDDDFAISADYFGETARAIAGALGPDVIGLVTNGASGDINNRDVFPRSDSVSGTAQSRRVARAVAAAAIKATAVQLRHEDLALKAASIPFSVTRRTITDADIALAHRILAGSSQNGSMADGAFSFVVGQPIPAWQHAAYAREVLLVAEMPPNAETELQIIQIGDLALVGMPAEVFVALGLSLREQSPVPLTTVVGLANDYVGYLPSRQAFTEGAYETWAARSAWPAEGTGEAMVEAILSRLQKLNRHSDVYSREEAAR